MGRTKGRSNALKQTKSVIAEGRADSTIDTEELGVEFLRQLGLEEDGGLGLERRHIAEGGKRGWGKEDEKRKWEVTRMKLTFTHGAFI